MPVCSLPFWRESRLIVGAQHLSHTLNTQLTVHILTPLSILQCHPHIHLTIIHRRSHRTGCTGPDPTNFLESNIGPAQNCVAKYLFTTTWTLSSFQPRRRPCHHSLGPLQTMQILGFHCSRYSPASQYFLDTSSVYPSCTWMGDNVQSSAKQLSL